MPFRTVNENGHDYDQSKPKNKKVETNNNGYVNQDTEYKEDENNSPETDAHIEIPGVFSEYDSSNKIGYQTLSIMEFRDNLKDFKEIFDEKAPQDWTVSDVVDCLKHLD